MAMPPDLRPTADGTLTLYCPQAGQTYHSHHGALAESRHVFVELSGVLQTLASRGTLRIVEVGLGAGLNLAVTAAASARVGGQVTYVAAEPAPLPPDTVAALGYRHLLPEALHSPYAALLDDLHRSAANSWVHASWRAGDTQLDVRVLRGPAQDLAPPGGLADAIYHDAFSPGAAPALWTPEFFGHLHALTRPGGCLTTYSTAGAVRRALTEAGWNVEKHPGPPGGKREVTRALRPAHDTAPSPA